MKKAVIALLTIIAFAFAARPAFSSSFSLSLSPPLVEIVSPPGKKTTYAFQLKNDSSSPLLLTPKIFSFEPVGDQGQIKIVPLKEECASWFSLINANISLDKPFLLPPHQAQQLVLKISPPQNTPHGDYYQTFVIQQEQSQEKNQSNSNSQTLGGVGANILLTISKTKPDKKAAIMEFKLKNALFKNFIDSFSSPEFTLKIKNEGEAFFKPQGEIVLLPDNQKLTLRPDNILAGHSRQIQCLDSESCQFKPQKFIGRYQATVKFTVDEQSPHYEKGFVFYIFPFRLSLAITIAAGVIILIVKRVLTR